MRAQSFVETAIQLMDLSQIWVEEQGFRSDFTTSAAALYILAKLEYSPGGQHHNALHTVVDACNALLQEYNAGSPPVCIVQVLGKEKDLLLHTDFELSVSTPSEWAKGRTAKCSNSGRSSSRTGRASRSLALPTGRATSHPPGCEGC